MVNTKENKYIKAALRGGTKGLISNIPVIGPIATSAWDSCYAARLEETVEQLSVKINEMDDSKIDIEYIQSEDFMDLFNKSLRTRVLSRSAQKARFIVGLLTESMRKDRNSHYNTNIKESFISILDELTDSEMIFLYNFISGNYLQKSRDHVYQLSDSEGIALDVLIAKGILREDGTWSKYITETMFGREFITYLKLLALDGFV